MNALSLNLSIADQYSMQANKKSTWGMEEYIVTKKNFDYSKSVLEKENMARINGKGKKKMGDLNPKAKRGGLFDDIAKRANGVPEPWKYQLNDSMSGNKQGGASRFMTASKSQQTLKFIWLNIPKESRQFEEVKNTKSGKLDMKISKNTFLDQIISRQKSEKYPIPGPGYHFLDKTEASKYFKDNAPLLEYKSKPVDKKGSIALTYQKRS